MNKKKKLYEEKCQFMLDKYPDIYQKMMKIYKEDTHVFFRFIVSVYIVIIPAVIFMLYNWIFNNKELLFPICLLILYMVLIQYSYSRFCSNIKRDFFIPPSLKDDIYEEMVDHLMMNRKLEPIKKENKELNQIFIDNNKTNKVSIKKRL